jgi:hypothetical protein
VLCGAPLIYRRSGRPGFQLTVPSAEAAYELEAFQPNLTRAEADLEVEAVRKFLAANLGEKHDFAATRRFARSGARGTQCRGAAPYRAQVAAPRLVGPADGGSLPRLVGRGLRNLSAGAGVIIEKGGWGPHSLR